MLSNRVAFRGVARSDIKDVCQQLFHGVILIDPVVKKCDALQGKHPLDAPQDQLVSGDS
eukprot:m.229803 g.229803  ORF g.229803 m.229803 type:complete len:59 (+) comp18850_c0_seq7:127-303(+)